MPWSGAGERQHRFQRFSDGDFETTGDALAGQFEMKRGVTLDAHSSPMLGVGHAANQGDGCAAETEPLDAHSLGAADVPRDCVGRGIHADPNAIFDQVKDRSEAAPADKVRLGGGARQCRWPGQRSTFLESLWRSGGQRR